MSIIAGIVATKVAKSQPNNKRHTSLFTNDVIFSQVRRGSHNSH